MEEITPQEIIEKFDSLIEQKKMDIEQNKMDLMMLELTKWRFMNGVPIMIDWVDYNVKKKRRNNWFQWAFNDSL